jgi:hypothetical protein
MAKINLSKYLKDLRGKVGDLIFSQMPDGSIVVSSVSKKKRRSSQRQKAYRRGTFTDRSQWAKWAQHEYPIYAELAAQRPMITAYNLAMSDIAHPPVIHRILCKDDRILVNASDEVKVEKVTVSLQDKKGSILETGNASQVKKDWWEYTPQTQVEGRRITASAWDIPGNRTRMVLEE